MWPLASASASALASDRAKLASLTSLYIMHREYQWTVMNTSWIQSKTWVKLSADFCVVTLH